MKDISPSGSSDPAELTAVGDLLYFTATRSDTGTELWVSDGTSDGTHIVDDIVPGAGSSSPGELTAVGETLFFAATGSEGRELWKLSRIGSDGVPDAVEEAAPGGGDGNGDSVPDSQQDNVTSLPNSANGSYVTLETPPGTTLAQVSAIVNPSPADAPEGVTFPVGFIEFGIEGIAAGSATTVKLFLPADVSPNNYYKYGRTADNSVPHWYPFPYDGVTGAIIDNVQHRITLHFVDGQRGDDDLLANGTIVDPGSPGFDPNHAPTAISLSNSTVAENLSVGTPVGTFSTTDPDSGNTFTYTLITGEGDADNSSFTIDGDILKSAASFNYEMQSSYSVRVRSTDQGGLSIDSVFTISVTNVTELGGINVQNGQTQRSYVRYLDVLFDQSGDLLDLINNNRLQLTKSDLNGLNSTVMSFPNRIVAGNSIKLDFGVQGIGGNRSSNMGDGYYELAVDLDNNGSFESKKYFYRLLGDVNGDRRVDSTDSSLTLSAYGTTNPERDVNGDGFVNANDRTLVLRALGRKLMDDLFADD